MSKEVSVSRAIRVGQLLVNVPLIFVMLIGSGLFFYLGIKFEILWLMPLGVFLSFIPMWLWWSVTITIWRIWAFENCIYVHDLKEEAIYAGLIWHDGSIFEKTEIRTPRQKDRLLIIDEMFKSEYKPELIMDDGSVPSQQKIFYSNNEIKYYGLLGVFLVILGTYLTYLNYFGFILILFAIPLIWKLLTQSLIEEHGITLSDEGILIEGMEFIEWSTIDDISVRILRMGRSSPFRLHIKFKQAYNGSEVFEKFDLVERFDNIDMSPQKFKELVKLYRQRGLKNHLRDKENHYFTYSAMP